MYVCENTLYMYIGRSTQHIKADLTEKGDLGVVAEVWCHICLDPCFDMCFDHWMHAYTCIPYVYTINGETFARLNFCGIHSK